MNEKQLDQEDEYIPKTGDRVFGKVHRYLTHVWLNVPTPTKKTCSGVIVKGIHNAMFLIKTDSGELLACSRDYIYKPT